MSTSTKILQSRYYRALPLDQAGIASIALEIDVNRTALVGMHCWNIGCPDGPPIDTDYCVGMGWPEATAEAGRIMVEKIRPAMDAARGCGLAVCHVETDWMDAEYPNVASRRKPDKADVSLSAEQRHILDRAHGADYMHSSPLAHMKRAEVVSPVGDEPMFFYSDTFDSYISTCGIDTLIYTGFATDMCVLGAEGGARPMLSRGYRCILMRDATVGVETPHSFPDRVATRYGIHLFEWSVGYSCTFAEFMEAVSC